MARTPEWPLDAGPFKVTIDGKPVRERVDRWREADALVTLLRDQHPGAVVKVLDRFGEEVHSRPLDE
jgi:hypothetical protein